MERRATAACSLCKQHAERDQGSPDALMGAMYGVRSVEVRHFGLEDIDWEREILCTRRPKERKSQHYPLVREVGAAILGYFRKVRARAEPLPPRTPPTEAGASFPTDSSRFP